MRFHFCCHDIFGILTATAVTMSVENAKYLIKIVASGHDAAQMPHDMLAERLDILTAGWLCHQSHTVGAFLYSTPKIFILS